MKIQKLSRITSIGVALLSSLAISQAQPGSWVNDTNSIWGASTNWLSSIIADGAGNTADFSTVTITASHTATLDSSRTLGGVTFGNSTAGQGWTVNASGGSVLTLDTGTATQPMVAVNTINTNAITAPIAGTNGLVKAGTGTLVLGGTNGYSGATLVNGGSLRVTNGPGPGQTAVGFGSLVGYWSFDNVVGNRVINQGSGGALMDGFLVGNGGVSVTSGGRYGNALNVTQGAVYNGNNGAAAGNGGYMFIDNPVVPLTCTTNSALSSWTVALWLQTTTQGAAYMYQGSGGWASGNTAFYLTSVAASATGGGVKAVGVRNSQGWEVGTTTINDGNWHHIVMTSTNGGKVIYVDGHVDAFLAGANQWNGNGVGSQLWIGGTSGTPGDGNVSLVGLIDEVAIYNRALTLAEVQSLTNGVVPGLAEPAIPLNSPVSVAAGAKFDINGNFATITNLTGLGTVDTAISGGILAINNDNDITFDGVFTNTPAGSTVLTVVKAGSGKLTLTGSNSYNGTLIVKSGTVNLTGTIQTNAGGGAETVTVGDASANATLNIASGATLMARNLNMGSAAGVGASTAAVIYNNGTYLNAGNQGTGAFAIGNATGGASPSNNSYAYFLNNTLNLTGIGETGIGGLGGGDGVVEVAQGTLNITNWITLSRSQGTVPGSQQRSLFLIRNGTVNGPSADQDQWGWSGSVISQYSQMDIGVGGVLDSLSASHRINMANANNAGNVALLTVGNGGYVHVAQIGASGGTAPMQVLNLNNGTLSAINAQTSFLGSRLTHVYIYSGGATISNNVDIGSIPSLAAPTGNGITSISVSSAGTGYIGRPIVQITDTGGNGATAIAEWSQVSGTVTGISITAAGSGYIAPVVTLVGGGASVPAVLGTPVLGTVASGGLTKQGTGNLTLTGGYSYTGPTVVLGGTLTVPASLATPSVAGDMTFSNAILNVDASSGVALPIGNLTLQTGATSTNFGLTIGGTALHPTGNLTLQDNVTLSFSYGTVSGNPTAPAINVGGSLSAPGTNIVINFSAFGLKTGTFTLIKYTGTPLAGLANITLGPLPPGVVAVLVNNAGSDSIDLLVTGTGQNLSWFGLPDGVNANANWDVNTTADWVTVGTSAPNLFYKEYTTTVTEGDTVLFDDSLETLVSPQPTNINLSATLRPFVFLANNATVPYSFSGAGGLSGLGSLVKSNTGAITLGTSNSFTGGAFLYGGTVIVTNKAGLGATANPITLGNATLQVTTNLTNSGTVTMSSATGITVNVVAPATNTFTGNISGPGRLYKTDTGTLSLGGSNGMSGAINVSQGLLLTSGTENIPSVVTVGDTATLGGTLKVTAGNFNANNSTGQFNSSVVIGSVNGAAGDVQLTGGNMFVAQQFGIGNGAGSYAAFNETGGALLTGSYIVVGFNSDTAVYNQTGGTCLVSNNLMTIAAGGTSSIAAANVGGGTFTCTNAANGGVFVGETGTGTLNVYGSGSVVAGGLNNVLLGRTGAASSGTVNLDGGTITTRAVTRGAGAGRFNFNGGTLKATTNNGTFMTGLSGALVYGGGVVIDDGGFAITVPQALVASTGYGVASVPIVSGGTGYIDNAVVTFDGGTGSNATAIAQVDPVAGTVTNILITCPGNGYLASDSLTANVIGGGGNSVNLNIPVLVANPAGPLTHRGAGTLTLTGANAIAGSLTNVAGFLSLSSAGTYSGSAWVNAGSLLMTTASTLAGNLTVASNAVFSLSQIGTGSLTISNLTVGTTGGSNASLSLAFANGNSAAALINCGTLTLNATNTISLGGRFTVGTFPLIKYTGAIAGTGLFNTNLVAGQGVVAVLSNDVVNSTLYAVIVSTGPGLVWTGFATNAAQTNVWNINTITNWLIGAVPTTYQESVPPGDAVTFNDSGSGVVILTNTVSPAAVLISNNAVGYTFQGAGHLAGSTGITKLGAGTAVLSLTGDAFSGDTVVSNGTLQLGTASALSATGNLMVGPSGVLEMSGLSESVNALNGSGIIDNNSANSGVLTVGSSGAGGTWNGVIQDQSLGGGLALTKLGTNTLVIGGSNYLNNGTASQVNGGTLIITNGGLVTCSASEFWVQQNAGSATVIVDGGTLIAANNWLVVGRNNAAANGTLILNHGTIQKSGANNVVLGSLGANGTLIVNGGQLLNNANLWLGENATGQGYLYVNGGLVQATQVRGNNNPAQSVAYFNGGIMQASGPSTDFFQSQVQVQHNGLIFDDGGFNVTFATVGIAEDGGSTGGTFVKQGAGTLYVDSFNTLPGLTTVTNGTMAGIGTIAGPVQVLPAGTIGGGDAAGIGELNIQSSLTLRGNATMRVANNSGSLSSDNIFVTGSISYGGTLTITNAGTDALQVGQQFTLFTQGGHTANFGSIVGSAGVGLSYSFAPATGILTVVSGPNTTPTNIVFNLSGNTLTLSWPADHLGWTLQSQTNNLATGLVTNGWSDVPGSSSSTQAIITIQPANPTVFYRLRY